MKNVTLWIGGAMLALLVFVMFAGPYLPFVDRELTPEKHRWTADDHLMLPPYPPSELNPIGSDAEGVDNLSKLIVGTKETVFIIFAVALVRYLIAVPLGLLSYRNKGPFHFITSGMNQFFSYLPTIFSAILLINLPFLLLSPNRLLWVIFILALLEVGRVAYIVQQQAHHVSLQPFVEAGVVLGLSNSRMARSYYLPALGPELIVNFCVDLGKVTLLIGQLGVLGIFLTHEWVEVYVMSMQFLNTSNNWVSLLAENRRDIFLSKFEFIFYPAVAIMYTILTFNVLGEGLRKHFNSKLKSYV
ncbi:ABC transporter permease [Paenibacillus marinisediminis]